VIRARASSWGRRLLRKVRRTSTLPFNLADSKSPRWDERAETAVALLAGHLGDLPQDATVALRIADFGAGTERLRGVLETHLEEPHTYSPFDLHPQSETVVVMDVTRELPDADFDVVFCLGLLEYVERLPPFLAALRARYATLVLSYALFDAPHPLTPQERRERGWLTDYTRAALEREFEGLALRIRDFALANQGRTAVWVLTR
jgi:SAM-dependent methyltransferase